MIHGSLVELELVETTNNNSSAVENSNSDTTKRRPLLLSFALENFTGTVNLYDGDAVVTAEEEKKEEVEVPIQQWDEEHGVLRTTNNEEEGDDSSYYSASAAAANEPDDPNRWSVPRHLMGAMTSLDLLVDRTKRPAESPRKMPPAVQAVRAAQMIANRSSFDSTGDRNSIASPRQQQLASPNSVNDGSNQNVSFSGLLSPSGSSVGFTSNTIPAPTVLHELCAQSDLSPTDLEIVVTKEDSSTADATT